MGVLRHIWSWNWNRHQKNNFTSREGTLLHPKTSFEIAEAYKAARTNLMFSLAGEKGAAIAFTSSQPGEGKTTTCLNLAITFAQAGLKILVMDGDLRKPQVHRYFDLPSKPGLSDVLGGLTEEICIHPTKYPNLSILTVGTIPPNPAELLGSSRMKTLLNKLKGSFDCIFIDSPPVGVVTDAVVLTSVVAGLVLIARQNYTTTGILRDTVNALEKVNARILGLIFNDARKEYYGIHRYYRSYKGKYRYKYGYTRYGYSKRSYGYQRYRYGQEAKEGYFHVINSYGDNDYALYIQEENVNNSEKNADTKD